MKQRSSQQRSPTLVALAAFAVYFATLQRSVPGGDAGELIAVTCAGGVAHPPGYPLFTLLARTLVLLPVGSPAWRVNLLSAICDAAAVGLVCAIVGRWTKRVVASVLSAGLFAFSPLVWSYATGAEVFALNNLFVAGLLYAALRWDESNDPRWAVLGAGLFGLGMSNHHTLSLFGVPLAGWMLVSGRRTLIRPRVLLALTGSFLAGLLPYAYLPIAAATHPTITWGDPDTLAGFARHVLRSEYGTLRLGGELPAGSQFFRQIGLYFESLATQTLYVGLLLAAYGCVASLLRTRAGLGHHGFARALLLCFAIYLGVFHFAANLPVDGALFREVTARFWQQPNLVVFVWMGVGFTALSVQARRVPGRLFAGLASAGLVLQLLRGYPARNERNNEFVARYARAILDPLPRGAVLLTRGDLITNSVRYLQTCEEVRTDVTVLDQELLTRAWYVALERRKHAEIVFPGTRYHPWAPGAFSMAAWIASNGKDRQLWVYPELNPADPTVADRDALWPSGLPLRIVNSSELPDVPAWRRSSSEALLHIDATEWPSPSRYVEGSWERIVFLDVWEAHNRHAAWLLSLPAPWTFDPDVLQEARDLLERTVGANPSSPAHVYKNLGIVYDRMRLRQPSLLALRDTAWREFLRRAPADDPDRAAVDSALSRLSR